MTLYAIGIRNAELIRLKISDVDSKRMVIRVQGGKGRADRDVMLRAQSCSSDLLCNDEQLRFLWSMQLDLARLAGGPFDLYFIRRR